MGCGPLLRRQTACTNVTANLGSKRPAFHTPSVAFGDTFPASRRRGARRPPAGSMTCVNAVVAPRRVGRDRNAPLQPYGAGSAGAEHSPPSQFPGRPRRDPRGLTARECCQCVQRRAPQFSLRSVAPSLEAGIPTRDRSADVFAIIARVSIFVEKLFLFCSKPMADLHISRNDYGDAIFTFKTRSRRAESRRNPSANRMQCHRPPTNQRPTVPIGTERLRITPTPRHSEAQVSSLVEALVDMWKTLGLPFRTAQIVPLRRRKPLPECVYTKIRKAAE